MRRASGHHNANDRCASALRRREGPRGEVSQHVPLSRCSTPAVLSAGLGPILPFPREDVPRTATRWQKKQRLLWPCPATCESSGGELCPRFKAGGGCGTRGCAAALVLCPAPLHVAGGPCPASGPYKTLPVWFASQKGQAELRGCSCGAGETNFPSQPDDRETSNRACGGKQEENFCSAWWAA